MGGLVPRRCLCEDPLDAQTIEVTSGYVSTSSANVTTTEVTVDRKGKAHVLEKPSDAPAAEDTDGNLRPHRSDTQDELSRAFAEAHALKDMSTKIADVHRRQPSAPIHQESKNPSNLVSDNRCPSFGRETPADAGPARGGASDLIHIKDELARTRQLLGLPPRDSPIVTPRATLPAAYAIEKVDQSGQGAAVPIGSHDSVGAVTCGPADISAAGFGRYNFRMPSDAVGLAAISEPEESKCKPEEEAAQQRHREDLKNKIKQDVAVLKAQVRLAKLNMLVGNMSNATADAGNECNSELWKAADAGVQDPEVNLATANGST